MDIERLYKTMSEMSLGDILIVAGQAVNMKMDKKRVDLILRYVNIALSKRKLASQIPDPKEQE